MMRKTAAILGGGLLFAATSASAGGYFGAAVGQSDVDLDGFDKGNSFSLLAGVRANENFALEMAYIDLGDAEDDFAPVWTLEASGLAFSAVGIAPVSDVVDIYGKLGFFMWDVTLSEEGFGKIGGDDGNDLFFGVGASFKVADPLRLAVEYQAFELDDTDVDNISLGLLYTF